MPSREIRKYFGGLVIIGVLAALTGCTTAPVDRIIKERGIADGIMLDDKGGITVIEAKSGQVVPSCNDLEKTDKKCLHRFGKDQTPTDVKIISDRRIRIIEYTGSPRCRTYVDEVTGEEHTVCRPPFSP